MGFNTGARSAGWSEIAAEGISNGLTTSADIPKTQTRYEGAPRRGIVKTKNTSVRTNASGARTRDRRIPTTGFVVVFGLV